MLRPGQKGATKTIQVRSIVGHFLEHSRVFEFSTPATTSVYLGSADLMPRNLDRRIEVLVPVESARSRLELASILDSVFSDDTNAWVLAADGSWSRCQPDRPDKPHSHQQHMRRRALSRARRASGARQRNH
jgi:polyphosphate kinase